MNQKRPEILEELLSWTRRYPELYEPGPARNTIANNIARLLKELEECQSVDN